LILKLGRRAGFRRRRVHPRGDHLGRLLYTTPASAWKAAFARFGPVRYLAACFQMLFRKSDFGLVVMYK
jgi:hypothetical protein